MKKKIVPIIGMIVVSAIIVCMIIALNPVPEYHVDPQGTAMVMNINGDDIPANEYAAYYMSNKMNIEQQMAMFGVDGDSLWSDEAMREQMSQGLRDNTESMLIQYHAILQKFQENGLKLDRDDVQELEDYKAQLLESYGGEEAFQEALVQQGLTEEMFDNSLVISSYAQKLNEYYFGENGVLVPAQEELLQAFHDNYLQAKHILINTLDESGAALEAEAAAEKLSLAEDILARAQAGEDFDALIAEYGEDPGMSSNPDGYIFTEGDMVDEFYQGTLALEENGISGLVESAYGYHIIKRMPLDESRVADYRDALVFAATGKDFSTLLQEWVDTASVTKQDEELDKITVDTAYDIAMTGITLTAEVTEATEQTETAS